MPSQKPKAGKTASTSTKEANKPPIGEKKGNYNPRRKIHTLDPAASKKPKPAEVRIKQLFGSLCAQIDGGHLANAIKTCDKSGLLLYTAHIYELSIQYRTSSSSYSRRHRRNPNKAIPTASDGPIFSSFGYRRDTFQWI
jgi:hypothetical protein